MAINYYHVPEQKKTVAVLNGTQFDACNKILKLTSEFGTDDFMFDDKYMMPDTFRVETHCHGDDVYDEATGERIAKAKLMKKYYKCFDSKIAMFKKALERLNDRVSETFKENT